MMKNKYIPVRKVTQMTEEQMGQAWKNQVCNKLKGFDLLGEIQINWFDAAFGFFMGLKVEPNKAFDLAVLVEGRKLLPSKTFEGDVKND